jgi:hypothetical protein
VRLFRLAFVSLPMAVTCICYLVADGRRFYGFVPGALMPLMHFNADLFASEHSTVAYEADDPCLEM